MNEYGDWREKNGKVEYFTPNGWVDEAAYHQWVKSQNSTENTDKQRMDWSGIIQSGFGAVSSVFGWLGGKGGSGGTSTGGGGTTGGTQDKGGGDDKKDIKKFLYIGLGAVVLIGLIVYFRKPKK